MRIKVLAIVSLALLLAAPAAASFESAVKGVNGVLTAVFDPLYGVVSGKLPQGETIEVPGPIDAIASRVVGGFVGLSFGFARAMLGAIDVLVSPFPKLGGLSPDPRVVVVYVVPVE